MKNTKRKLAISLLVIAASITCVNPANATDIAVSVSPATPYRDYQVNSQGGSYEIWVFGYDSVVQLYRGTTIGDIDFSEIPSGDYLRFNDDIDDDNYDSYLTGTLDRGNYVIRVSTYDYFNDEGDPTDIYTLRYEGLAGGVMVEAAALRKSVNLEFSNSLYGSDKLSDPDGQLRKLVDHINDQFGSLIK